ncbi:Surface polysaccharide O-acyltransferase WecH (WecH) [Fructobacillus fructosus]|uniref:acyltransferase n=1 Tax=Fructobacillus fructosus TaxID=1631 RepID=UPI002D9A5557|nr:Surface polysaccharide O-acyltransferase WecH (WecH) [Fructobacillus fructosus]
MKRYYYMDVLNILATLAVVFLHSSTYAFTNAGTKNWYVAVVLQVFFIFAVPIFFMISGANILDYRKKEDTATFFKKRFKRIALPFLSWSIVWFLYYNHQEWHYSLKNWHTYGRFFNRLMHDNIQLIFWFFYIIIAFYIAAPILSKIFETENRRLVLYLITIYVIFSGLISYYYQLSGMNDSAFVGGLSIGVSGGIGYFAMGWYLKHFPLDRRKTAWLTAAGICSMLITIILTIIVSKMRGEFVREAYSIWGVFAILWSASIYNFFQYSLVSWTPSVRIQILLKTVASTSLGVYVVHYFFIDWITHYQLISQSSLKMEILVPVLVWIISTFIVLLIQKIPFFRRTV